MLYVRNRLTSRALCRAIRHRLTPQALNEGADVFHTPSGRPRPDLDRLGKAPVPDALGAVLIRGMVS
jgi:hypothetical protein